MNRLRQIVDEQETLAARLEVLGKERRELELVAQRERYNCPCVRLNRDVGIYDMSEQFAANRRGLNLGLVADTLSAVLDCPMCGGEGMRK